MNTQISTRHHAELRRAVDVASEHDAEAGAAENVAEQGEETEPARV